MPISLSVRDFLARAPDWPKREWALFDLREAGEYAAGHIYGATSLPRRMLEFRLDELMPDPSWPVVVYDSGSGDGRALLGAARMAEMGIADVLVLEGGTAAWKAAGQPLATGVNVPCKTFGEHVLHDIPIQSVTPGDLHELRKTSRSVAVCDVRTSEEFAAHHLPGACSLPGFELAAHLPALIREHEHVFVNCAGRTRSIIAAATAQALGFNCRAVENGTMGWRLAGFPVESGASGLPETPHTEDTAAVAERAQSLARMQGVGTVSAIALAGLRAAAGRRRPYLVDVRTRDEFLEGHIAGARWLPGGQAIQRTDDFLAVPGAPVVVVDDGDARGWLAAWWLRRMGLPSVQLLKGGMRAWREAGLEVETGNGRKRPKAVDRAARAVPTFGVEALQARLRQRSAPLLLDVGTSKSFARAHLPGAVWLPRGWLEARTAAHAAPDDEIIATAVDPAQALLAAATLHDLGFTRASALSVGTLAWAEAGGAVEAGPPHSVAEDVVDPPYEKGLQAMRDYLDWEIRLTIRSASQGQRPT